MTSPGTYESSTYPDYMEDREHKIVDPEVHRCRCGKLKTEPSPGCEWHRSRNDPTNTLQKIRRVVIQASSRTEFPATHEDEVLIQDFSINLNRWDATAITVADGSIYRLHYDPVNHCTHVAVSKVIHKEAFPDFT